jgi:ubiquinol oxidase
MRDVVYAVRSDETTHRFVNHSLANLNTATDVNPFALREPDMFVKGAKIEYVFPLLDIASHVNSRCRFDRSESEKYMAESRKLLEEKRSHPSAQ